MVTVALTPDLSRFTLAVTKEWKQSCLHATGWSARGSLTDMQAVHEWPELGHFERSLQEGITDYWTSFGQRI
jgi:hypothetical protein